MKRFKVKRRGEIVLLRIDGEFRKFGFYAATFVAAKNTQEAKKLLPS